MLINILGGIIETIAITLIGTRLNNIKYSQVGIKALIITSFFIACFIVFIKEDLNELIYLISIITFTASVLSLLTSIPFLFSALSVLYGSIILIISEAITVLLLNTIISIIELSNSYTRLMIAIIDSSVIFTIYFIINKYNFHITDINKFYYKYGKNNNKNFYIILLLSFSSLFYLFYIFKRFGLMEFDFYIILIVIILIFIFYLFRLVSLFEENKLEEKFTRLLQKDAEIFFNTIQSQRHDFIHHLNAINLMIKQGKFMDVKKYIEDLTEEVNIINELLPLHSPAISGLMLHYIQHAKKKNIHFIYDIQDSLKTLPIKEYEANQILGNLLQNAFECVEELPLTKRTVHLHITCNNDYFIFSVMNNIGNLVIDDINHWFVDGYSTKSKEYHSGNGLATIKRILKNYNGEIYPEIRKEEIKFIIFIPRSEQ
ncbi:sensor histidine kinase [Bacillus alveayuensis]|uniref:sensor histidine kinase n=1 Tax=Aeribacillus alveayuensis TaxID=279215 RepID=UPI0005D11BBC|nr:GHKL domain-containing protein [Bacillus alveayuensis]